MSHRGTHCANIRTNVGLSHFFQSLFIAMFEVFSSSVLRRKNRKKWRLSDGNVGNRH